MCCQVEISASSWWLVQRSPTKCGACGCDREASIMRRPWPMRGCRAMEREKLHLSSLALQCNKSG